MPQHEHRMVLPLEVRFDMAQATYEVMRDRGYHTSLMDGRSSKFAFRSVCMAGHIGFVDYQDDYVLVAYRGCNRKAVYDDLANPRFFETVADRCEALIDECRGRC